MLRSLLKVVISAQTMLPLYASRFRSRIANYTPRLLSAVMFSDAIKRNEDIKCANLRVVYSNPANGKNEWKILSRSEALLFAKSLSLDLILGTLSS